MNRFDILGICMYLAMMIARLLVIVYLIEVRKKACACMPRWRPDALLVILILSVIPLVIPFRLVRVGAMVLFTVLVIAFGFVFLSAATNDKCACVVAVEPTWIGTFLRGYIYVEIVMLFTLAGVAGIAQMATPFS